MDANNKQQKQDPPGNQFLERQAFRRASMELTGTRSSNRNVQTLPPRRGQIKIRIIKTIVRSAAALGGFGRRNGEGGTPLSSPSATPPIPSEYNSDS
ncbi:hypothetical protein G2W53_021644 [Senna tora]|uniref:Uncharacterized protein n=1 Tax=Senna tora TaxID=362788 RepID=A0A834TKK6_9FABA|nr:hypothetical protein G2W53_021644 [Senna tora]